VGLDQPAPHRWPGPAGPDRGSPVPGGDAPRLERLARGALALEEGTSWQPAAGPTLAEMFVFEGRRAELEVARLVVEQDLRDDEDVDWEDVEEEQLEPEPAAEIPTPVGVSAEEPVPQLEVEELPQAVNGDRRPIGYVREDGQLVERWAEPPSSLPSAPPRRPRRRRRR
jgi:hypothetical protein